MMARESAFERLLGKVAKLAKPSQCFKTPGEMTDQDWELARFKDPRPGVPLFSALGDRSSFPLPVRGKDTAAMAAPKTDCRRT